MNENTPEGSSTRRYDAAAEQKQSPAGLEALIADIRAFAEAGGATATAVFRVADIELREEVRAMCAADRCHSYGKNWMCPPHVGDLATWRRRIDHYSHGVLIQHTCQLEDSFDYESMAEGQRILKEVFANFIGEGACPPGMLLLTCGTCTLCPSCGCPDTPCRFPDRASPSLEAIGILVTDLCKTAGLPYYYGPNTLTWSGGILV
ncbi:MAG: DUF2284 domain-containing protein [Bacillota bacterium]|nr:DUF2284 domain-containing protein [Bacillota bacterium]